MEFSEPDYLEKENLGSARNEAFWQALPDYCICNEGQNAAGTACVLTHHSLRTTSTPGKNVCYGCLNDIRELTSGYFAGDEALRDAEGNRLTPIQLLLRIILSSTNPGDIVLDPFAGSGTTLVVAEQLNRKSIGIELDAHNVALIQNRLTEQRESDNVSRFFNDINVLRIWKRFGGNIR